MGFYEWRLKISLEAAQLAVPERSTAAVTRSVALRRFRQVLYRVGSALVRKHRLAVPLRLTSTRVRG
jgi:hypothetical protein